MFPTWNQNVYVTPGITHIYSLGDGSINIRDYDFIIPVPQIDGSFTTASALVLSGNTEHNLVSSLPQIEMLLTHTQTALYTVYKLIEDCMKSNSVIYYLLGGEAEGLAVYLIQAL